VPKGGSLHPAVAACRGSDVVRSAAGQLRPAAATAGQSLWSADVLPGGACEVGGNDVGRMPVQAAAGPVIPHGGTWPGTLRGARHSASVKAGWIVASAVDGAAVVIGHVPAGLRPERGQLPGPSG
jgi:hypothetical protein